VPARELGQTRDDVVREPRGTRAELKNVHGLSRVDAHRELGRAVRAVRAVLVIFVVLVPAARDAQVGARVVHQIPDDNRRGAVGDELRARGRESESESIVARSKRERQRVRAARNLAEYHAGENARRAPDCS